MSQMNVVVIGGVSCGPKSAARIKRLNPEANVTLIEKGEWISYGGCGLPYYVGSVIKELNDLMTTSWDAVRTPEFLKATKDIDTLLGYEATEINRNDKTVTIKAVNGDDTKVLPYDKLVLATGSYNAKPPIPGIDGNGVFEMKTPHDGVKMQDFLKTGVEHAVIIGAGLIGMEVMEACANWGVDVTVVEMLDQLFPKMLDKEMALVLQHYLETQEDMNIMTGTAVKEIKLDGDNNVVGVVTDKGEIECQMVLVATGVRSEVSLAKAAGLECDPALIVNEYLQTSDPDIYAGGDCVMVTHRISGQRTFAPMGSTANKHGRIIGTNIVTNNTQKFPGVLGTSIVKLFDWSAGKTGLTEREAKELGFDPVCCVIPAAAISHFMPGRKNIMLKTVADRATSRILGVQVVGPGNGVDKRVDTMAGALSVNPEFTAYDMANMDLAYAPPFSSAVDNLLVNGNVIQNLIEGRAKQITFFDTIEKLQDDNVCFVDLRVDSERSKLGTIPAKNQLHIPVEEIRARSNEVPKDKEIILFCNLSTRGYEAQLILEQAGFTDVKFLQGGIFFWPFDKFVKE